MLAWSRRLKRGSRSFFWYESLFGKTSASGDGRCNEKRGQISDSRRCIARSAPRTKYLKGARTPDRSGQDLLLVRDVDEAGSGQSQERLFALGHGDRILIFAEANLYDLGSFSDELLELDCMLEGQGGNGGCDLGARSDRRRERRGGERDLLPVRRVLERQGGSERGEARSHEGRSEAHSVYAAGGGGAERIGWGRATRGRSVQRTKVASQTDVDTLVRMRDQGVIDPASVLEGEQELLTALIGRVGRVGSWILR